MIRSFFTGILAVKINYLGHLNPSPNYNTFFNFNNENNINKNIPIWSFKMLKK